ncbi:hypothetical protein LTR70_009971 [Exophiala xenobiotica]|uniref:DNA replication checkpoint mediator MRC1 domain-containing protein n=1 Tax=Lithohypha guttulata TaxID=1690604 RepID=A0ABR0KKP4_9EURO|nr:hypothetical protein LTR24_001557 [Lithohypha guttulata]KAK5309801.1 hypothetical protein LTR70_009971 [Exophiala xenobiotica]
MATSPVSASSRASSPSSSPPALPTKRSVQALLDELSDSDSDVVAQPKQTAPKPVREQQHIDGLIESSDDDVLVGAGRLAARLAESPRNDTSSASGKPRGRTIQVSEAGGAVLSDGNASVSEQDEDEPATFHPKRRLLLKRKRASNDDGDIVASPQLNQSASTPKPGTPTRSVSPSVQAQADLPKEQEDTASTGKSKFTLLVEKARKERLAREEAERAKKAARQTQGPLATSPKRRAQRGSSPADDSEEDSDQSEGAPAKRLTKDARPTRKASKKALEEMNRETQRMNRNMQLAHQARTKKKFTKESFFAKFGQGLPTAPELLRVPSAGRPASSSSAPSSDAERTKLNSTPPTSPMLEPEHDKTAAVCAGVTPNGVPRATDDDMDDGLDFLEIMANRRAEETKPIASTEREVVDIDSTVFPARVASMLAVPKQSDSDSGSDIEVVFAKGSKRKYVAFENLPKRKAKETSSHLALRSLAHIKNDKGKKPSMSTADMGPSLLRAARKQAQEERQAKIEKLKAAGVNIQTAEEREQDQEELEDLVERARLEDEAIRKREKVLSKKDGTYTKDALDEEDSDEDDEDYEVGNQEEEGHSGSDNENDGSEGENEDETAADDEEAGNELIDAAAEESAEEAESGDEVVAERGNQGAVELSVTATPIPSRIARRTHVVVDDEDDDDGSQPAVKSPELPAVRASPQSIVRSARKVIPGLQHSDDLPLGLTQAFAATMADSQTQDSATQEQDSMDILRDLPSPQIGIMSRLNRLDSVDMVSESIAGSQTQPLDLNLGISQSQQVPESPARQFQPATFELTQDPEHSFSPFTGNRFAETPSKGPHSTEETTILPIGYDSPVVQRRGRLQRGRQTSDEDEPDATASRSAFLLMKKAAKQKKADDFNKKKSEARQAFEEAAEESDDEYAGLGGASDEDSGEEENEDDRQMIDEDTQIGRGDEAKLAKLYADRERQSDEQAVSKLLKDITTGALRRKRGAGDDLDLSDEEDAVARRRQAKQREFARMRRELLKDEAVGKIADDKRKQAFLKSIEDREDQDDNDNDFDQPETPLDVESQSQSQQMPSERVAEATDSQPSHRTALKPVRDSQLNTTQYSRRASKVAASRRPGTLAEIRESVSFLIEEPDSQAEVIDLGLSDSEDEPEAYINLDRHIAQAEADEDAMEDENEDLGDFVVDDEDRGMDSQDTIFKKPELPGQRGERAPFAERRTKSVNVVDRLSMLREQSSSSAAGSNASSKMAFLTGKSANGLNHVPSLLRRATTNSSLGSISGRDNVSATGVVTSKTERGGAAKEKEFAEFEGGKDECPGGSSEEAAEEDGWKFLNWAVSREYLELKAVSYSYSGTQGGST